MEIETVEDLANKICDWIGIYGACKNNTDDGCEYSETKIMCCRVGFMMILTERIRNSVANDEKILKANFK